MPATPVTVLSNHALHLRTAIALQESGRDVRFIGPLLHGSRRLPGLLPEPFRSVLARRGRGALEGKRLRSLGLLEGVVGAARRGGLLGDEAALTATMHAFDAAALLERRPLGAFHFHAGLGLRSAHRARARGARLICDDRGPHVAWYRRLLEEEQGGSTGREWNICERLSLEAYALADRICVASEAAAQTFIEEGIPRERLWVLPYGLDDGTSDPRTELQPLRPPHTRPLTVLFAGRLSLAKGLRALFEGFHAFGDSGAVLELAGPAEPNAAGLVEEALRRDPRIRRLGPLPAPALAEAYRRADVLVLPTLFDSFGLVVAEATAQGTPVVVSDRAGIAGLLRDGESALLIPPRSAESLTAALNRLDLDRTLGTALVKKAREALSEATWRRYGTQLDAAYRSLSL